MKVVRLSDARTPEQQARAIEQAVISWRADLRRRHEAEGREAPVPAAPVASARRRPTLAEDDADWFGRAALPWPRGTR